MGRLNEHSIVNIKNKSHSVSAELVVSKSGAEGVIIAQGGAFTGWSLYAKDGKLKYCYNLLGIKLFYAVSDARIATGKHQVRMEFQYDGGGLAKGGNVVALRGWQKGRRRPRGNNSADGFLGRRDV